MKSEKNALIWRGATDVIVREELEKKLAEDKPLRIKYGIDPTGDKIHIGHASVMRKLQHFQSLGHTIVLIVGDFTAQIGDTSDKESERPAVPLEEIKKNVESFKRQLGSIFDFEKAEIHYNSTWFNTMGLGEFLKLSQLFSVAQMLERDNFKKRYAVNQRIGMQEFLYPALQGYDSIAVGSDVEIGGTDQLFNILAGRTIQKHFNQAQQHIITYELLVGSDGRKMSKSWGNAVWVDDVPNDMFGKLMSVHDDLIFDYIRLCTDVPQEKLDEIREELVQTDNPRNLKAYMAKEITTIYHGQDAAIKAEDAFNKQFQQGALPDEIETVELKDSSWKLIDLLVECKLVDSKSAASRVIEQGGVRINQKQTKEITVSVKDGDVLQVGKRGFKRIMIV